MAAGSGTWGEIRATGRLGRFALLCLGVWLHAADSLVTATAVPAIVGDLGGVAYVAWTITLYQIGAIVAGAAAALLCGRHGTERVLSASALLYGLGCLLAAMAPSMGVLLAARLLQGLGGGTLLALGYVAIQQWFPEHLWGRLFGAQALIWAVGSLVGPLLGGAFVAFGFWRGIFWSFALQALLLWLLTMGLPARSDGAATGRLPLRRIGPELPSPPCASPPSPAAWRGRCPRCRSSGCRRPGRGRTRRGTCRRAAAGPLARPRSARRG